MQALRTEGFAGMTMMRVGKIAGLSTGTVQHYFEDKAGLLAATLAALNKGLSDAMIRRLRKTSTPLERIHAIADAQFDEDQFSPDVVATWHALWANVAHMPELQRLQRIYERRIRSNVRHALSDLVPAEEIDDQADALLAMIDGLWVKAAQPTSGIDAARARHLIRRYLDRQLHPST